MPRNCENSKFQETATLCARGDVRNGCLCETPASPIAISTTSETICRRLLRLYPRNNIKYDNGKIKNGVPSFDKTPFVLSLYVLLMLRTYISPRCQTECLFIPYPSRCRQVVGNADKRVFSHKNQVAQIYAFLDK